MKKKSSKKQHVLKWFGFKKKFSQKSLLILLVLLSLALVGFHHYDVHQNEYLKYWAVFYIWVAIAACGVALGLSQLSTQFKSEIKGIFREDWKPLLVLVLLAIATRFYALGSYPYVSFGDEMRDAGLHALNMYKGEYKDIFGFGSYDGYGNFIPLISHYLIPFFGNTTLAYRIPMALVGILSVVSTYVLAKVWTKDKWVAWSAGMILLSSYFHMHYSRAELVNIFSTFWTPILALLTYSVLRYKKGYLLLGLLYGLLMHFYIDLRVYMAISAFLLVVYNSRDIFQKAHEWEEFIAELHRVLKRVLLVFSGFIITLGPTWNTLYRERFMSINAKQAYLFTNNSFVNLPIGAKIAQIYDTYIQSLLVLFVNSTDKNSHFPIELPLLFFPVGLIFVCTVGYLLLSANKKIHNTKLTTIILSFIFISLLFTQVLLNGVGQDHRMQGLTSLTAVVAGLGFVLIVRKIFPQKIQHVALVILLGTIFIGNTHTFFTKRYSETQGKFTANEDLGNFKLQSMVYYIAQNELPESKTQYHIANQQQDAINIDLMHYKELITYFSYPKKVDIFDYKDQELNDSTAIYLFFVDPGENLESDLTLTEYKIDCKKTMLGVFYNCPIGETEGYSFFVLRYNFLL